MALNERTRHLVHEEAKRTWKEEAADTLMEMLPPVGWADVATKHDIDALRARIDGLERHVDTRFATKEDLHREINRLILWFVPFNIGIAVTVARLAG